VTKARCPAVPLTGSGSAGGDSDGDEDGLPLGPAESLVEPDERPLLAGVASLLQPARSNAPTAVTASADLSRTGQVASPVGMPEATTLGWCSGHS
jgi:hypothetical protein